MTPALATIFTASGSTSLDLVDDMYRPSFRSGETANRSRWEALERERANRGQSAGLQIRDLRVQLVRAAIARAEFTEAPEGESDRGRRKVLLLRLEEGKWKILEERSADSP